jgi:hypothetical protein
MQEAYFDSCSTLPPPAITIWPLETPPEAVRAAPPLVALPAALVVPAVVPVELVAGPRLATEGLGFAPPQPAARTARHGRRAARRADRGALMD